MLRRAVFVCQSIRHQSTKNFPLKFNAISNKNILAKAQNDTTSPGTQHATAASNTNQPSNKPVTKAKINYDASLPRVPQTSYISPLQLQMDSLYSQHRPLLMTEFPDNLLPRDNILAKSWVQFPSSETSKLESADSAEIEEMELIGEEIRQVSLNHDISDFLGAVETEQNGYENERGWQRTPFALSATGIHEFQEWDGIAVGHVIRGAKQRIQPYQRPLDSVVTVVEESKETKKVSTSSSLWEVEQLFSNPPQKKRRTRGRVRPQKIVFKKKN